MTIKTTCLNRLAAALVFVLTPLSTMAAPAELVFRLGLDRMTRDQSDIVGLSGLSLFVVNQRGYYIGQSLYSAALGQGGGFFVGGLEVGKYSPFGKNYFWDASLFIGGGGGASQVPGDGLMLRPQVQVGVDLGWGRLGAGVAFTSVSGSAIASPSFGVSLSRPLDLAASGNPTGGVELAQMRASYRPYFPVNSRKRNGVALQPMQLIGAEMIFAKASGLETFIAANGAVAGDAEGYADWQLGRRALFGNGALTGFAELAVGVGGGGGVNTGGGLIVSAGAGLRWQPGRLGLELGFNALGALNGDFLVLSPVLKLGLEFGGGQRDPGRTDWQISTGLTQQFPNAGFRKPGVQNTGAPLMIDTKIDLFLTPKIYLSGQAYTALAGGAGGYQIGLVGFGYRRSLGPRWALSGEGFIGAGGGAGVDTRGGLLLAYGVDLDFAMTESLYLTLGAGQVRTMQGGGMAPLTVNVGFKVRFATLH